MNKREVITLVIILCGLLLVTSIGAVMAMESANFTINWDVIGSGGKLSTSASFALDGTIGQSASGSSSGASYNLCSGYWCAGEIEVHIYLPLVMQNN